MKLVLAIIRPEKVQPVENALMDLGISSLTVISVLGRGQQKGIEIGTLKIDKLPKTLLLIAVVEEMINQVKETIRKQAYSGNIGDGKIFILPLEAAMRIRTGEEGAEAL
ncbi:MAG: P-II family nitrogen regulator [Gloeobacterales cyanobacterium]